MSLPVLHIWIISAHPALCYSDELLTSTNWWLEKVKELRYNHFLTNVSSKQNNLILHLHPQALIIAKTCKRSDKVNKAHAFISTVVYTSQIKRQVSHACWLKLRQFVKTLTEPAVKYQHSVSFPAGRSLRKRKHTHTHARTRRRLESGMTRDGDGGSGYKKHVSQL